MADADRKLGVCLIGCGFMGRRHLLGYGALRRAGLLRGELTAVLDVDEVAAESMADEAQRLLGRRPAVFTDLTGALADPAVEAVDIVTDPRTHHLIAIAALDSGRHVLCEKPLGLTVASIRPMLAAAAASGAVLATAENYRRGGANRTARAVLDAGLLGRVHLMVEEHIGGTDAVIISRWRHLKSAGAISLDMGTHLTDIIEYYLGPVASAYGRGLIAEPVRRDRGGETFEATGEDSLVAVLRTESGVDVHLTYLPSGPGHHYIRRTVHGTLGSMAVPPDRSDGAVVVRTAAGELTGEGLHDALGNHLVLDPVTVALLGPDGSGGHGTAFADVDAGYLGVEIADFLGAALDGRAPEVDGLGGLRAVADVYAVLESGVLGREVTVAEVLDGSVQGYQVDINRALGLLGADLGASRG